MMALNSLLGAELAGFVIQSLIITSDPDALRIPSACSKHLKKLYRVVSEKIAV
jgi:hypothetical protein